MTIYYREKIFKLHDALFLSPLSARQKFQQLENHFGAAYFASKGIEESDIRNRWEQIWQDLNKYEGLSFKNHEISAFVYTVGRMRNKSIEKYLHFILEEFHRARNM